MGTTAMKWLHGLIAGTISAGATAASGALALPSTFNFTSNGLANLAKIGAANALLAALLYLAKSPIPAPTVESQTERNVQPAGDGVVIKTSTVSTTKEPE